MIKKQSADVLLQYDDEEIARRRDDVIRRMANTPPKLHSAMKVGNRKAKATPKANRTEKKRGA